MHGDSGFSLYPPVECLPWLAVPGSANKCSEVIFQLSSGSLSGLFPKKQLYSKTFSLLSPHTYVLLPKLKIMLFLNHVCLAYPGALPNISNSMIFGVSVSPTKIVLLYIWVFVTDPSKVMTL